MKLINFDEAVVQASDLGKVHTLLGNGFSRACRDDIFSYDALFDRADFKGLSHHIRDAFDALGTQDFEAVIRTLRHAASLLRV